MGTLDSRFEVEREELAKDFQALLRNKFFIKLMHSMDTLHQEALEEMSVLADPNDMLRQQGAARAYQLMRDYHWQLYRREQERISHAEHSETSVSDNSQGPEELGENVRIGREQRGRGAERGAYYSSFKDSDDDSEMPEMPFVLPREGLGPMEVDPDFGNFGKIS